MNSETIYQIIHSILADEATDEERRIFTECLDASDANRAEYEKLKRLYQVTTHRSKNKTFNTEFAWQQVHKQTISKKMCIRDSLTTEAVKRSSSRTGRREICPSGIYQ